MLQYLQIYRDRKYMTLLQKKKIVVNKKKIFYSRSFIKKN